MRRTSDVMSNGSACVTPTLRSVFHDLTSFVTGLDRSPACTQDRPGVALPHHKRSLLDDVSSMDKCSPVEPQCSEDPRRVDSPLYHSLARASHSLNHKKSPPLPDDVSSMHTCSTVEPSSEIVMHARGTADDDDDDDDSFVVLKSVSGTVSKVYLIEEQEAEDTSSRGSCGDNAAYASTGQLFASDSPSARHAFQSPPTHHEQQEQNQPGEGCCGALHGDIHVRNVPLCLRDTYMRETQSDDDDMQWESDSDAFPDDVSTIFSKNGVLASAIPSPDGSFKSSQRAKSGTESGMTSPNKSPKDCLRHDFADYAGETEPYTLDYYFQTGYITHKATRIRIGEQGLLWPQVGQVDPIDIVMDRDGELLGAGGGGFVRRGCHRPTRRPVAIKVVKMEDKNKRTQFLNDLYALLNVTSDFLITLFGAYIDRETGCFHTVLEFMDMGSLLDLQKRCPEGIPDAQLSFITLQVVKGLECLHTHSFVHRDIKLSNILINLQGAVKITDFGISKRLEGTNQCDTFVGTSTHLSPERIMGIEYGKEADIWSLGLCVYELACGKYPFENVKSFWDLFDAVNRLEPPILPDGKNPALQEFINKCLAIEPAKRFTALELQKEPFILLLESPLAKEDLSAWTASVMGEPSSPMLQLG